MRCQSKRATSTRRSSTVAPVAGTAAERYLADGPGGGKSGRDLLAGARHRTEVAGSSSRLPIPHSKRQNDVPPKELTLHPALLSAEAVKEHEKDVKLRWDAISEHSGSKAPPSRVGSKMTDDRKSFRSIGSSVQAEYEPFECSFGYLKRSFFIFFTKVKSEKSLHFIEFVAANVLVIATSYQCGFQEGGQFDGVFAVGYTADLVATASTMMRLYWITLHVRDAIEESKVAAEAQLRQMRAQRALIVLTVLLSTPFDLVLWFTPLRDNIRWYRIIHLIPCRHRIARYLQMLEHSPVFSFLKARLLRTCVYFFLSAHTLGCLLNFLSNTVEATHYNKYATWRTDNNNQNNSAYTRTLYFSILSLSSVHTDDAAVDRDAGGGLDWEYWIGIGITMMTNIVFMYVSSNLTSIMLRTFQRIEEYRSKLTMVILYLKRNRLSGRLSKLVLEHFRDAYENLNGELEEEQLLKQLPLTLSREVRHEKNMRVLRRSPILFGSDKAVLRLLAILVRQVSFLPEETVCTQGDVVRELLLLQSGALQKIEDEEEKEDEDEDEDLIGAEQSERSESGLRDSIFVMPVHTSDADADGSKRRSHDSIGGVESLHSFGMAHPHSDKSEANRSTLQTPEQSPRAAESAGRRSDVHRRSDVQRRSDVHRRSDVQRRSSDRRRSMAAGHQSDESQTRDDKRRSSCKVVRSVTAFGQSALEGLGVIEPEADKPVLEEMVIQVPGKAVCELAFFFGVRQPISLMAIKRTSCLLLDMESWKLLAKEFPQDAFRIQKRVLDHAKATEPELVKNVQLTDISDEMKRAVDNLFSVVGMGDEASVDSLCDPHQKAVDTNQVDYAGNTPLHIAALRGHAGVAATLLKHGALTNEKDGVGRTPLEVAVHRGHTEVARTIFAAGGRLGWDEVAAASELCETAKQGHLEKLSLLVTCGAKVNSCDYDMRTVLHLAAHSGNRALVDILLHNGAQVNAADRWGGTPLRDAVRQNHRKVAMLLFKANGNLNYDEAAAAGELCELARQGDADRLQLLIDCGCSVDAMDYDDRRCMHLACSVGNKIIVKRLLNAKAAINCKDRWGGTPLNDAIREGHLDLAEEIIKFGGTLEMDDLQASAELCELAREGKLERVHLLLEGKANIDAADYDRRTCLHLAASTGNLLVVQSLIHRKANISVKDRWEGTPLADAIREGHNEVAKLLIRSNADLGFDEDKSAGTLCELARQGNMTMIHVLLSAGCDPNAADYDARTCLHLCASEGGLHMIEELVRFSANLDSKDRWGGTPLADAVREGHGKVAELLHSLGATLGFDEATASNLLSEYARAGDLEKLKLVISCGASVNAADNDKRTCMHLAASVGNLKVVQALIEAGANLNFVDRWGGSPLADAIREGHRQVAHAIREAGGEVLYDEATASGELCEMARCGNIEGIKLLLSGGCSVNAADYDLRTCMHLAASSGNLLVVEALIEHKCDLNAKDRWGGTPLADAVREGHGQIARVLRAAGAELSFGDGQAAADLCEFARVGDSKGIKLLLDGGASVNACDYDKRTCLHLAAAVGNLSIVRMLIEEGAQLNLIDRVGRTPLSDAIRQGHTQCAHAIREAGGALLYDEATASGELCEMARCGNIEGIMLLLSGGCSVNAADYDLRTCMHLAASSGNLLVVEALIEHKCDLNAKDRWGGTPLADAVREGHGQIARVLRAAGAELSFGEEIEAAAMLCSLALAGDSKGVKMLLDAGAPVNARNRDGRSCLHVSSAMGNLSVMGALLQGKADINLIDNDQRTCLHLVASSGLQNVAKELLKVPEIDVNLKDRWGSTPLASSLNEGHYEVANELVSKGGKLLYSHDRAVFELCAAARKGQTMMLRLLIEGGIDPDAKDYDDRCCLMLASSSGNLHVVKMLLSCSANVNAQDRWGGTALADAVREGHTHVMHALIKAGAKIFWDKLTVAGKLCDLAAEGNVDRLENLLDCGLDPNTSDYDLRTPLHLAASAGHVHIVEHLIGRDVDVHCKDRWGGTPLDDAEREQQSHVIPVLKRAMELSHFTKPTSQE
ncbi:hypothetical protein AB1Y20_015780 [Prymnesium parvum]|uniref:Uncharacterized protein n=1 Tax=Prymnesium parvum TaxID=97485 RepID=A0AB34K1H3_PRYPA